MDMLFFSLDDILQKLAGQVDNSQAFSICVTRSNFFHRALQQWKRQKRSTPKCSLNVCFVGEAGIDTGAIKKEFLTGNYPLHFFNHLFCWYLLRELTFMHLCILAELMSGIEMHYFEPGNDNKGKNPIYSISALEDGYFRCFLYVSMMSVHTQHIHHVIKLWIGYLSRKVCSNLLLVVYVF